ncbi:MAG TPA: chemotaxis protein CheW [Thermoanaerobaculia bacterium]|nr:chemotaxis protein CheW [Thermoanaerobaculia bacterium]
MTKPRRSPQRKAAAGKLPAAGLSEEVLEVWDARAVSPDEAPEAVPLGPERLYELADRLAHRGSKEDEAPQEQPETWVGVEVAGEVYVLPVERVQEVLRVTGITRLPYAPAPVRGITHQRGRVLTVVDLRVRLGFEPAPTDSRSRICVVFSRGRSIGLLVDAARHVVKLLPSGKQPPPADVMTQRSEFILGVYRLEEALIILLDVDRVLLLDEDTERTGAGLEAECSND